MYKHIVSPFFFFSFCLFFKILFIYFMLKISIEINV